MPPITITTLTAATVQQDLQNDGLDALGLATLRLSTRWSDTTPGAADYDATNLTLDLTTLRAPFRGIREFAFSPAASTLAGAVTAEATSIDVAAGEGDRFPSPAGGSVLLTLSDPSGARREIVSCTARTGDSLTVARGALGTAKQAFSDGDRVTLRLSAGTRTSQFCGSDGNPLSGPCAVLRLHPQAVLRLETLVAQRYVQPGNQPILAAPWAMVVRGAAGFTTAKWYEPDEAMTGVSGSVSFHDNRGFIVDPIHVAGLLADLQAGLPGLTGKNPGGPVAGAGGVQSIARLATGTLVHVLDLHGRPYQPALAAATLVTRDGSGNVTAVVPATGLVTLGPGDGIDTGGGDGGRLRWGWLKGGTLGSTNLVPPALPGAGSPPPVLPRPFYQLAVVDTVWALLGNRTAAAILGIPGDDQKVPPDVMQQVRDNVAINYLVDGPDVLGQSAAVLARPSQDMVLAVSPVLDGSMAVPGQSGVNAHWPAFPAPNSGAGFPTPPASPQDGMTAAWTASNAVVVTIAADKVPDGAHVRIFQQRFVTIPAITADPSFVRGDGGAAIASAGAATAVLLRNPFALAVGQPRPSPANLTMDIVVIPRSGTRKIFGAISVAVAAGPVAEPADPFAGVNAVAALPATMESIAPAPLFDIPTTVAPPAAAPGDLIAMARALASESSPRQGPRLATMARFDTIVVTGTTGGTPAGTLSWEAVLSGGHWARQTRCARQASGNPGNPAGPDVHAAGIHVSGALAYDLARHAIRRAQAIIPVGAGSLGWVASMGGTNFDPPSDLTPTNTGIGAVLETVAAVCETPELSALATPAPGATVQGMLNGVAASLGVPAPTVTIANEARLQREVRREFIASKNGFRDALWCLRRALREARELVYIESPQFAHTGTTVDLVNELATSLGQHPELKVLVCTPREADFSRKYRAWARQHYRARIQAVGDLLAVAPDRVAAFHPPGFPGRTAFIRTTTVIVDDVFCLSGATHFRRRGMTFDGSVAVSSFDRQMDHGYSKNVRALRRALMAGKLAVPTPTGAATSEWIRLGHPESAFQLVEDWLAQGGLGRIEPLWPGPADSSVLPASDDQADPDGTDGATLIATLAGLIAELGDGPSEEA
jgi:hypothetical protein